MVVLCMLQATQDVSVFFYLCNIDTFKYVTQNVYNTKYALLYHHRTYTKVYIGIRSTCMCKGNLNSRAFIKVRIVQSVEHRT